VILDARNIVTASLFVGYVICSSCGLLLFKSGVPAFEAALSAGRWWSRAGMPAFAGAGLYAISFVLWLVIASRIQLTVAYPLAIGLSLAAVTAGAVIWLGEPLSATRMLGSALILGGIALVVR